MAETAGTQPKPNPDATEEEKEDGIQIDTETTDGQVFVEVDADEMSVKVTIIPPQDEHGKSVVVEDVRRVLGESGVTHGIFDDAFEEMEPYLKRMAEENFMADPIEVDVAGGKPKADGVDAHLDYLFRKTEDEEAAAETPVEEAEKKKGEEHVDFRETSEIENIPENVPLVRKVEATMGQSGTTVRGVEIPAEDGKDIEVKAGPGVKVSAEDPNLLISEIGGQVIIKDNEITVKSIYEVKGDVDFSVGNIDFLGTVIVGGDVKEGFTVKAGEDIVVKGVADAAHLECGGNLTINGGFMGQDKGTIKCEGEATIKYINNAKKVEVDKVLTVQQAILSSDVVCQEIVNVAGSKGAIVGGKVIAGKAVNAATLGNHMATPTEIVVGALPGVVEETEKLGKDITAMKEELERNKKGVDYLKALRAKDGELPEVKKELLQKMTKAQVQQMAELNQMTTRFQELEKLMESQDEEGGDKTPAKVNVSATVYTGVKVKIHEASRMITEELKYCTLMESEGEVKVGPYSG